MKDSNNNKKIFKSDLKPEIGVNQIWLSKKIYSDKLDKEITGLNEYYLLVVSEPLSLDDSNFVRVQPISDQIEYKADDDIHISNTKFIGFPFIIETWNEQPVLIDLLDKYIATLEDPLPPVFDPISLNEQQTEFRKSEIRNTGFLRQSVLSLLSRDEQAIGSTHQSRLTKLIRFPQIAIAAALIGIALIIWQPGKMQNEKLYNNFIATYPNELEIDITSEEILRGNECFIEGFTTNECETIVLAMELYDSQDYENVATILERINNLKEKNEEIFFYLSVSQLLSDQIQLSIYNLEYLASSEDFKYTADVKFYLALAYIKNKNLNKARRLLKSLERNNNQYSGKATLILKDMRWF